jgi:hypothetical protein
VFVSTELDSVDKSALPVLGVFVKVFIVALAGSLPLSVYTEVFIIILVYKIEIKKLLTAVISNEFYSYADITV